MKIIKFPDNFKWGSATSAHQIEGNNNNDWSRWEKSEKRLEELKLKELNSKDFISGQACDSYNRYEEDFDIAKKLNQNIHRFSIEWSRIEPEEGKFDLEAMKHYQRLVNALRDRGIEPMVTLWHFTNPIWFADKGGFLNKKSPEYFARYVGYVVDNLKEEVSLWITFNEADSIYPSFTYLRGLWPPGHRLNIVGYFYFIKNVIKAHTLAYREIKSIYGKNDVSHSGGGLNNCVAQCGVSINNTASLFGDAWYEKIMGRIYSYYRNLYFISRASPSCDFIGLNYYHVDRRIPGSYRTLPKQEWMAEMNWEIYPKGIYYCLIRLNKFKKPIYITENGIADSTDELREKFIKDHLYWTWKAIQDGVDVRGYMYWSLLDNFEWSKGFAPRFGLVEIDYEAPLSGGERKIRPSAWEYAKICISNQLEID